MSNHQNFEDKGRSDGTYEGTSPFVPLMTCREQASICMFLRISPRFCRASARPRAATPTANHQHWCCDLPSQSELAALLLAVARRRRITAVCAVPLAGRARLAARGRPAEPTPSHSRAARARSLLWAPDKSGGKRTGSYGWVAGAPRYSQERVLNGWAIRYPHGGQRADSAVY